MSAYRNPSALHPTPPGKLAWLVLLVLFWAGLGLTGRDAWKQEEALAFDQVWQWLLHGRLPVASPLYVLVAGGLARLTEAGLNWQDGARLASGLFTLLSVLFTALSARRLFGPGHGAAATLLLMGAFGLMLRAHALLPETALLAAYALLLLGLAEARGDSGHGAWLLGTALMALVLARGVGDGLLGLVLALALPLMPGPLERGYRRALPRALLLSTMLLLAWLGLLLQAGQIEAWWTAQWAGMQPAARSGYLFSMLVWFAWPAWPLALWAVWHEHRKLDRASALHLPLLASAVLFLAAHLPSWSRDGAALPLLLPLTLLAAQGIGTLRRGGAQAFYWFGVTCFMFFAVAFWIYFSALEWGRPEHVARHLAKLVPGYQPATTPAEIGLAAAATLLWLLAVPLFPRAQLRPALVWATGMALTWTLVVTLYRPWIEAGWGYRPVAQALRGQLTDDACVRLDVDAAARVMFAYHLGRQADGAGQACAWRLLQSDRPPDAGTGWRTVWHADRPRQKGQVFWLQRRD